MSTSSSDDSSPEAPSFALLSQLQSLLLSTVDVSEFLTDLAVLSTQVISAEPVSCGITARYGAHMLTVASSDARAERLDETQYEGGAGPCLQALNTGKTVISADTATEARWPAYTASAAGDGLRCSMSLPLTASGVTFGAMNVYGFDHPNLFGETEQRQYRLFAAQAAGSLRLATRQAGDTKTLAQLEEALSSRTVIDQAIGVLVDRHQLSTDQAFALLRQQSQTSHRKLRDVATDLVTGASGSPPTPGRPFTP